MWSDRQIQYNFGVVLIYYEKNQKKTNKKQLSRADISTVLQGHLRW